jgi:hypothetical protein
MLKLAGTTLPHRPAANTERRSAGAASSLPEVQEFLDGQALHVDTKKIECSVGLQAKACVL